MSKKISREEVAKHNKENDRWVIINNKVYDVSRWQFEHPGNFSKEFVLTSNKEDKIQLLKQQVEFNWL